MLAQASAGVSSLCCLRDEQAMFLIAGLETGTLEVTSPGKAMR
jgi:hypothetical protein